MTPQDFLAIGKATGIHHLLTSGYGWAIAESLHFIGLAILLGTVGLFDLRMLGFASRVPLAALHRLVPFGVAAYLNNIVTGSMFFLTMPDQYLYNPAFQVKLCLMAVAGANVVLFYTTVGGAVRSGACDLRAPVAAKAFAAVSLAAWLGVIVAGRVITLFRPPAHWCLWC